MIPVLAFLSLSILLFDDAHSAAPRIEPLGSDDSQRVEPPTSVLSTSPEGYEADAEHPQADAIDADGKRVTFASHDIVIPGCGNAEESDEAAAPTLTRCLTIQGFVPQPDLERGLAIQAFSPEQCPPRLPPGEHSSSNKAALDYFRRIENTEATGTMRELVAAATPRTPTLISAAAALRAATPGAATPRPPARVVMVPQQRTATPPPRTRPGRDAALENSKRNCVCNCTVYCCIQ